MKVAIVSERWRYARRGTKSSVSKSVAWGDGRDPSSKPPQPGPPSRAPPAGPPGIRRLAIDPVTLTAQPDVFVRRWLGLAKFVKGWLIDRDGDREMIERGREGEIEIEIEWRDRDGEIRWANCC